MSLSRGSEPVLMMHHGLKFSHIIINVVAKADDREKQSLVVLRNTVRSVLIIFGLEELLINPINGAQSIGNEKKVGVLCLLMGVQESLH